METPEETGRKLLRLSDNPETEVVPFGNCVATSSAFSDGLGTATPVVVSNSPNTHIAGTVHIHHASLVYKNMKENTALKLKRLKESNFIETRTAKISSKQLSEVGFILLEGGTRSGKTTVGLQVLKKISTSAKYIPVILDRPEDYVHIPPSEKVVVLIDDIFGRAGISPDSVLKWEKILKDMLELPRKDNVFLVVTCGSTVLQESRLWNAPDVFFQPKYNINLESNTNRIRDYEKYFLLSNLVQKQRLKLCDSDVRNLSQSIVHPWFYGCCDYLRTHRMDGETFKEFFKQPFQFQVERLQSMALREPLKFAILVLLIKTGSLPDSPQQLEQIPDLEESLKSVQNAVKLAHPIQSNHILTIIPSLGEYVTQQGTVYVFRHESVEDAVCFLFGRQCLEKLLLWCPERFLIHHTALEAQSSISENCLLITEHHYAVLKMRFIEKPSHEMFAHLVFSVERFVEDVFDDLSKAISDEDRHQWLLLSIKNQQRSLVRRLIPLLQDDDPGRRKKRIHEAFEKACEVGDVPSFHALRKIGAKPCETCFQKACQLEKNQIVVGGILFELSIDFETLTGTCLANCIEYLIKVNDQHNLDMVLQQLPSRNDSNSLIHKALKNACSLGKLDFFHHLRDQAMSIDFATLLNYAIQGGNADIVEWLTDAYIKSNSNHVGLGQYFLKACMLKEETIAELIANHDPATLQAKTEIMDSAVHIAASVPIAIAPTLLSWLIHKGLDVGSVNTFGQTPLHTACQAGNIKTVKFLLDNNADASVQDNDGNTPFHSNLMGSNPSLEVLDMLLEHGADLTSQNHQKCLPFHNICGQKSIDTSIIVAWILERQKAGIDAKNAHDQTPLHLLLEADASDEALELILDCKVNINIQDKQKQTPLHIAATKSNASAVEMLLVKGCDPLTVDNLGQTALHIAVSLQSETCAQIILQWLQKKRMSVDTKNADGQAVLHIAAKTPSNSPFFLLLLESNIQLSPQDKRGLTALHILCARCTEVDAQKLSLLLMKGAFTDAEDENGITPLHNACMSTGPCKLQMVQSLLQYGADSSHLDRNGKTALHKICLRSSESDVQTVALLLSTTDPNSMDSCGNTPLHIACVSVGECAPQLMQILTSHGAAIEIQNNERNDVTDVCIKQSRARFHTLLELVARSACESGSRYKTGAIRSMMAKGGFSYGSDENGYTMVHKLCMVNGQNTHEIIDYFLTHGVDVNAKTKEGKTALHVACMAVGQYTSSVLDVLKRRCADMRARDLQGETALHKISHVCNKYSASAVRQLGSMGADPNTRNLNGDTALHVAFSSRGDFVKETTMELIALGADLTCVNYQGRSSVDFDNMDSFQLSELLHVYCKSVPMLEINQIHFLVSKGADITSRDSEGDTVLHILCSRKGENTHTNISTLLQAGADVSLQNAYHLTPYDVASFSGLPEKTISMIHDWKASNIETEPAGNSSVPMDTEEQTTQISTALLPYRQDSNSGSTSGSEHPLQYMHDQMDERKERAKDSITSSLVSGNYNKLVDDLLAVGTAELFRGGIKTLIKRDKNK